LWYLKNGCFLFASSATLKKPSARSRRYGFIVAEIMEARSASRLTTARRSPRSNRARTSVLLGHTVHMEIPSYDNDDHMESCGCVELGFDVLWLGSK
jgi:hypothetical protein